MKNTLRSLAALIMATGFLTIAPATEAKADIILTVASLGLYPIGMIMNNESLITSECIDEAVHDTAAIGALCPLAFILDQNGKYVMAKNSKLALFEQGLTAEEISVTEARGALELSHK
jgi:hypothetical protein